MFDFHQDKLRYFEIQKTVTAQHIIPFVESHGYKCEGKHVLEIGCAEAGVLKAFIDYGNTGVGIELSKYRYDLANTFLATEIAENKALIINRNIYDIQDVKAEFGRLFDVIILKDVIEHIPEQEKFIPRLKDFLAEDGVIFFAYPPWWMPFGGHQQVCSHKLLRTLPWFHLLPFLVYGWILKLFREKQATIDELFEIKSTGINIERMYRILHKSGFAIVTETMWLINPIYKFKFGLSPRILPGFLSKIPFLRNFYTTAHYILFKQI